MYDCIHAYIDLGHPNVELLYPDCEYFQKMETDREGRVKEFYKVKNMTIIKTGFRYTIRGSFATFLFGNNRETLNRFKLLDAINYFKRLTELDVTSAIVTRLEVSSTLLVAREPKSYFSFLVSLGNMVRTENRYSLYLSNSQGVVKFYDKKREMIASKTIDRHDEIDNLLRYELLLTRSRLSYLCKKHFGQRSIVLHDLTKKEYSDFFIYLWQNEYHKIEKLATPSLDLSLVETPKDVMDQLSMYGLQSLGGYNELINAMERYKSAANDKRPEFYTRVKCMIRKMNNKGIVVPSNEILELNKIDNHEAILALKLNALQL